MSCGFYQVDHPFLSGYIHVHVLLMLLCTFYLYLLHIFSIKLKGTVLLKSTKILILANKIYFWDYLKVLKEHKPPPGFFQNYGIYCFLCICICNYSKNNEDISISFYASRVLPKERRVYVLGSHSGYKEFLIF